MTENVMYPTMLIFTFTRLCSRTRMCYMVFPDTGPDKLVLLYGFGFSFCSDPSFIVIPQKALYSSTVYFKRRQVENRKKINKMGKGTDIEGKREQETECLMFGCNF